MIIGNWKMYKTAREAEEFISFLKPHLQSLNRPVMLAVPFTALATAARASQGSKIRVGAQNMHDAEEGAFTGEISATMLKDAGAEFVLLGHSERRHLFHESDLFILRKVRRALKAGIMPVLCIGEKEEEKTEEVLKRQLQTAFAELPASDIEKCLIAYEPVWAIGTGKTATPEMADEAHGFCRAYLKEQFNANPSILYGGSVNPKNISALLKMPNIQGALVGGASLDAAIFLQLIQGASS